MSHPEEQAIRLFRVRLATLLILKNSLAALTLWAFLAGTLVLALRGAMGMDRQLLLWGLLSLPLALVPAVILALRRLPAPQAVRALLDRNSSCGGLLMAGAETEVGRWRSNIPSLEQPRLHWRSGRSWALLSAGVAFLLVGFLLPQSFAEMGNGPRLEVGRETVRLTRQIDVLKEEKILEPLRADDLKTKVEKLRRDALGRDPAKTLEAMDHLKDVVSKAARDAVEGGMRKNEEMGRTQTLAEVLKKRAKKMDAKTLAEAMSQLAALSRKAAEENEMLKNSLDQETLEAIKNGTLSPDKLDALLKGLQEGKGDVARKLARLAKAGLIDPELLEQAEKAGEGDLAELAGFLKDNGASDNLTDEVAMGDEGGRGGTSRGPGPAAMAWKDPSTLEGVKFKEEVLPPSALKGFKDSVNTGLSAGAPKKGEGDKGPAGAGALEGAATGGGSASTQIVLPRHRHAVERYFDRTSKSK